MIVAVLSLGGAALSQSFLSSISGMLAGFVLLTLGALSPWALLRLMPLGEIASAAVGSLRAETLGKGGRLLQTASGGGAIAHDWGFTTAEMRREADGFVDAADPSRAPGATPRELPAGQTGGGDSVPVPGNGGGPPGQEPSGGGDAAPGAQESLSRDAADGVGGAAGASSAPPRSPGMGPIWQADDFAWPTLKLGPEHGWPPRPIADAMSGGVEHSPEPTGPAPDAGPPDTDTGPLATHAGPTATTQVRRHRPRSDRRRPRSARQLRGARGPRSPAKPATSRGRLAVSETGASRLSYRFGPLERRGILGAVRAGQAALLAGGAAAAIAALDISPSAAGAFAASALFAAATALAFVPVGRRTAEEWAPTVVAFAVRRLRGRHRFASAAPALGIVARGAGADRPGRRDPIADPPPSLSGVALLEVPYRDRTIGVVSELRGRRLTSPCSRVG